MIARCVGAGGHYTYEYNPQRAEQAAQEFADHGLHYVTCRHADVCAEGWAYPGLAESSIDAVIFDLPQPWDAVPRVAPFVKQGGRLCCFSPCIEQIQRTKDILPERLRGRRSPGARSPMMFTGAAAERARRRRREGGGDGGGEEAARGGGRGASGGPEAEAAAPEGDGGSRRRRRGPAGKRQRGDGKAPAAAAPAAAPAAAACGLITKRTTTCAGTPASRCSAPK